MDLNYLFARQQQERHRADVAACDTARRAHDELARRYEDRIREATAERVTILRPR